MIKSLGILTANCTAWHRVAKRRKPKRLVHPKSSSEATTTPKTPVWASTKLLTSNHCRSASQIPSSYFPQTMLQL